MRKLAMFAGGFCVATFLFVCGIPVKIAVISGAALLVGMAVMLVFRKDWARRIAIVSAGAAVALIWCAAHWQIRTAPIVGYDHKTVQMTAEATEYSQKTDYGTSTIADLELNGKTYRAVLYGQKMLEPGDRVVGRAQISRTGNRMGEEQLYYGAQGVSLRASLYESVEITKAEGLKLRYLPAVFSARLKESLQAVFPAEEAAFETALLSGDESLLPYAFYNQLGLVGLKHVVAVSGMHIAILTGALFLVLGARKRLAAWIGLPLIWFFALSVGMTASVVRAAVMQSFLVFAPLLRRENDAPTSVLTALMLLLLANPSAIMDVGLQLSFASVAGILLFSDRMFQTVWQHRRIRQLKRRCRFIRPVLKSVLAQAVTSVSVIPLTLPLCILYFKTYSLVSPLSGMLVVTVVPLCFSLGILAALCAMICLPLGQLIAWPVTWLVRYCMTMTRWLSEIPFASIYVNSIYMAVCMLGIYAVIVYLLLETRKCKPLVPICSLAGLFSICVLLSSMEYDSADFTVTMLDVGQGQCVYLESKGNTCIYDCGGNEDNAGETAARFLQSVGRSKLDMFILSHYDMDHAGGMEQLLSRVEVDAVYLPPASRDDLVMQQTIIEAAQEEGTQVVLVSADLQLRFGAGLVELYAPVSAASSNDSSLSACWNVSDFRVLLTGDMSESAERRLVNSHALPEVEVLVAGHHGAATSTGTELLQATTPETVLISVGENSYGHPAEETLERLGQFGASVYRTDQCGNITVRR